MKILVTNVLLALAFIFGAVRGGDAEPTALDKAVYAKARYEVVSRLNDDDFVSYCVTMNLGGDTLLKIHDEIMVNDTELGDLIKGGLTNESPQVVALNNTLRDLRNQLAVKVQEARKGLEVEAKVAETTLAALSQYSK